MTRDKLFLIDAHSLLYRAHYAMRRPLINSKGRTTTALFGFVNMLLKLLQEEKPRYCAVAFDKGKSTFRHKRYEAYKGTRRETPDELREQFPLARDIVRALRLPIMESEEFEADDLLGSAAKSFADGQLEACIVTGDRDALQLVDENVRVLLTKKGVTETVLYDPARVEADYGVNPAGMIELKGLQGDSSDNIPGVKGVGPKKALELITRYGSIDGVYEHLDELKGKLRENLEADRDAAYLSRWLGTIDVEAPTGIDLADCEVGAPDNEALVELASELELKRLRELVRSEGGPDCVYEAVTDAAVLEKLFAEATRAAWVALDTETTSTDARTARLVGFSFAFEAHRGYYVPLAHVAPPSGASGEQGGLFAAMTAPAAPPQIPAKKALAMLARFVETTKARLVAQNGKYDLTVLRRHGVPLERFHFDTMLAAYLLQPTGRRYNMDSLALDFLGRKCLSYDEVVPKGHDFSHVPIDRATRYAAEDAEVTWALRATLGPRLEAEGLEKLFREVEMPLVEILADMESTGIWVDRPAMARLSEELAAEIAEVEEEIYEACGERFNLNSPKQLSTVLFEKLDLPVEGVKKGKTGYSTRFEVLQKLARKFPVAHRINHHRHLSKLRNTYLETLPGLVGDDGRIHCSFHQTITATGRLSASEPNLQNIPVRDETGRRIRAAFRAHPADRVFVGADYSQIELRILAHLSGSPFLRDAFANGADIHRETAARLLGKASDAVSDDERNRAKAVNFGILYGMSAFRLQGEQDFETIGEAQAFIDAYFAVMPEVRRFMDETLEKARATGEVQTLLGRRRAIPELGASDHATRSFGERIAINTPIQGSAADLIKVAMIRLHGRFAEEKVDAPLILQIHDELIVECLASEADGVAATMKDVMESAMDLDVPIEVKTSRGRNWGELK